MESIAERIGQAEDWSDLIDVLEDVKRSNVGEVKALIPELASHSSWVVRTEVLDIIGGLELKEFLGIVRERLSDRVYGVRSYALRAYYDLLGKRARNEIREFCKDKHVRLRLVALCLEYVETKDKETLTAIERIVTRKRCDYHNHYAVLHTFESYLATEKESEIVELYRKMLAVIPKEYGVAKDIRKRLREIKKGQAATKK